MDVQLGAILGAIELIAQRSRILVLPRWLALVRCKPLEVGYAVGVQILAEEKLSTLQDRETARERDRLSEKLHQVAVPRCQAPVEPTDFVVLTVRVVDALLRAPELVASKHHGSPAREHEAAREVLRQLPAEREDRRVAGFALRAAVPGVVVVGPVLVVLAVALVVLPVVRDQIVERESVMAGNEVHAIVSGASVAGVEIRRSGEPPAHLGQLARVALAEAAHGVPEAPIPFGPIHRKVPQLVRPGVPGPGDQDPAAEPGVLRDRIKKTCRRPEGAVLRAAQH